MRKPIPVPASNFLAVAATSSARRRKMPPDSAAVELDPAVVAEADLGGEAAVVEAAASVAEGAAGVAVLVAVEAVALRKAGSSAIAGNPTAFMAWCSSI
jgi:hypothetical protein